MNHKTLRHKTKAASKRSSLLCLGLAALARMDVLTPSEKDRLRVTRLETHKAIQFASRLQRRLAKVSGAAYVPELTRASFKKKSAFLRLKKTHGAEAAVNYLLGESS